MKPRVAISVSSFAGEDSAPLRLLEAAGVEIIPNPHRRRLTEAEIIAFLPGVHGLLAGLEPLNRCVLESARGTLRALARVGIGIANVDLAAAKEFGIAVSNTPDGPTEAVAELTLAALLSLLRNLGPMDRELHAGGWPKTIGRSLAETTVLVIGFGRIGRRVAATLHGLGAAILVCDPFLPAGTDVSPFRRVELDEGLHTADAISLHASGEGTLLGEHELALVRPGTILLNSARGGLVDEGALVRALEEGRVGKAWFDAFWQEPYKGPLLKFPQVLLTPHSATYTRRCRLSMESEAARNVLRDLGLAASMPA